MLFSILISACIAQKNIKVEGIARVVCYAMAKLVGSPYLSKRLVRVKVDQMRSNTASFVLKCNGAVAYGN